MVVRRRAPGVARSGARRVVVAADDGGAWSSALPAARRRGSCVTRVDHASGSDRLAEACTLLGLDGPEIVVNVQGDEPLIDPALIRQCADLLETDREAVVATAAHTIASQEDFANPNVVKVVVDAKFRALYFSRAPLPWWRATRPRRGGRHCRPAPCRTAARCATSASTRIGRAT